MKPRIVHVASGREWRGGQNQVRLLARALQGSSDFDQVVVTGRGTVLAETARGIGRAGPSRSAGTPALDPRALLTLIGEARGGRVILHAHDAHALVLAGIAGAIHRGAIGGYPPGRFSPAASRFLAPGRPGHRHLPRHPGRPDIRWHSRGQDRRSCTRGLTPTRSRSTPAAGHPGALPTGTERAPGSQCCRAGAA